MGAAGPVRAELLVDRAVFFEQHRRHGDALASTPIVRRAKPAFGQDRRGHADLQRNAEQSLRGLANDFRGCRDDGAWREFRLVLSVGHHQSRHMDRRGAGFHRDSAAARRVWRARLLSAARKEHEPQGRQYRRFRFALGRRLRAYGRARRGQPDDGRDHRSTGRRDGGGPRFRHHPDAAADHQPQHLVRAGAAVRGPDLWSRDRRRSFRVDGPRRQLLGAQRDHPHGGLRALLRSAGSARAPAVGRPYIEP